MTRRFAFWYSHASGPIQARRGRRRRGRRGGWWRRCCCCGLRGAALPTSAALHDLGRVCLSGGKATFSYDERWLVFHHYVLPSDAVDLGFTGPDDPGFAEYLSQGSSNLVLVDLRTGTAQARDPSDQRAAFRARAAGDF